MLARSPFSPAWVDESPRFSSLMEAGKQIAVIDMAYGHWEYRLEQSIVPHRHPLSRTMRGGYTSKLAAQTAAESHIAAIRANDGTFARSDAAALGREALAGDSVPDSDDEHRLVAFDFINHMGRWA